MAGKSKGGNTISTVWEIVEPYAKQLDLKIWDIRFVKEGATHYLRIFIDKEGGVGLDDCVDLSHAIDNPLDDADPIDCSYCLEVSTPGIERELTRPEHFEINIGQRIKLKLIRAVNNQRDFKGTLKGFGNGQIIMVLEDGEEKSFDKKDISWVRLDDFDSSDD